MAYKDQNIPEEEPEPKVPKVFISYNHKDESVALKIKDRLENAGFEVIIYKEAIATGQSIPEFIKKCIKESVITLSLISANSLMSSWVAMETIWSSYDEILRGRYFMPCNIDDSFFKPSFADQALDVLDRQIKEIDNSIQIRLQKGHGIEDLTDEKTRIRHLKVELPSIIGRLKYLKCTNLSDAQFESGIVIVIGDIKKAFNLNILKEPIENEAKKQSIDAENLQTSSNGKKRRYLLYPAIGLILVIVFIVLNINILPTNSNNQKDIKVADPTVIKPTKEEKLNREDKKPVVMDRNNTKNVPPKNVEIQKPEIPKAEPPTDELKIVEPQMVNIILIVNSKYSGAQIFVDNVPAQIIKNTLLVKTIRVELNKNHIFRLVSGSDSCETIAIFVTTDNQKITSCD